MGDPDELMLIQTLDAGLDGIREQSRFVAYQTVRAGIRTAVAAIMGRNMSHNPGSHGLAYLIADIEKRITSNSTLSVGEEEDLKNFLKYVKARMDFVAEVTTYWREMPWLEQLTL